MPAMTTDVGRGETAASCGGRLVSRDGRELILREATLRADAGGGLARVVVEQRFANPFDEPLALVYQLPLPAEGAVSGFAFRVGERRIAGEIDRCEAARHRFEEAILEGRTAGLLEQDRSSLFTQEIGNVPPRAEVVAEITVDHKLRWLAEGAWEWRFPTVVAPRYLGSPGRVSDAGRVTVDVLDGAAPAAVALELAIRDALSPGGEPDSPSHAIAAARESDGHRIRFARDGGAALDRDVVVRWPVATAAIGARLEVARPAAGERAFGLLTLVPPTAVVDLRSPPRDLVVLIDASGSMDGAPLEQARCIAQALVRSLDPRDTLELIAFSSEPLRFRAHPEPATEALRTAALEWLGKLQAGGGTEMDRAVAAALAPLRPGSQRQVVLVTDGLIGFEHEVVSSVLRALPDASRVHAVGVGSAVNRSLTAAVARAGRGVEIVAGLDEDGGAAAERLLTHVAATLAGELEIGGSAVRAHAPARLRDLAAGAPVLVSLELDPAGGELEIRGRGFERRISVPAAPPPTGNPALAALFARERVEDLEMRACAGERTDLEIEGLGLAFGIATRRTSWVAVSEEPTVDPRRPTRRVRIAQQVPHGLSLEGFGLPRHLAQMTLGCGTTVEDRSVLRMRFGFSHSEPSWSPDLADEAPAFAGARERRREGRILSLGDVELVVEIEVGDEGLDWDCTRRAQLFLGSPEAEPIEARVDRARSTASGRVEANLVIRVVLLLAAPLATRPSHLRVDSGEGSLLVTLES